MKLTDIQHHCNEVGDCYLWKRATANGHPCIRHEGRNQLVRRTLWVSAHGPIPAGHIVRAKCGDKLCINPAHTELTTFARLGKELGALGIMSGPIRSAAIQRTKRRTQGKLSIEAVREIRASDETTIAMAEKFGVAQAHISKIRKNKCQIDYSSPFAGLGAMPARGGQKNPTTTKSRLGLVTWLADKTPMKKSDA